MKKYWLILFIGIFLPVFAGENLRVPDIRALGMGGNGVTLSSVFNPALLECSSYRRVRLDYFNRYALKELGTLNGSIQYPNRFLSTALYLSSFGYDQYRQNRGRIGLAKHLSRHWAVGIGFQYTWIQSELYAETPARLSTDLGVVYTPVDKLLIGFVVNDLPSVRIAFKDMEIKELNTYEIQAGFNYKIMNGLLITGFVSWNEANRIKGGLGMEFRVWERFSLRTGVQTAPFLPSLGTGFHWKWFGIDAVALWHPVLGVSSGVGLSYSF